MLFRSRLLPVFPTSTFPNHVSLATGAHVDRHGIVGNVFFDPRHGLYRYSSEASWIEAEPVWVSAERQGVRTASFFWVGSESDWRGTGTTYRRAPFDSGIPEAAKVDQILAWLDLPELLGGDAGLFGTGIALDPDRLAPMTLVYEVDDVGLRWGITTDADLAKELIDPFGGLTDLAAGMLRTPIGPEVSFSDDPLRMLRMYRFVSTLGFAWEYEARSRRGRVEHPQQATPLMVDGVLYVSGPWGSAFAVDARSGRAHV